MNRRQLYQLSTGLPPTCVAFFYNESLARTQGRFVDFFRQIEDEMICIELIVSGTGSLKLLLGAVPQLGVLCGLLRTKLPK